MRRGLRTFVAMLATLLLLLSSVALASAQTNTTNVVRPEDVGPNGPWYPTTVGTGGYALVNGPATPPLGQGSVEFTSTSGDDSVLLENNDFDGTLLSDIQGITYATYRSSTSTNPAAQYPYVLLHVAYNGGASTATFLWEPVYSYGQDNLKTDTWQTWDTMAASQTGEDGGWWSSTDAGSYTAYTYVSWQTLLTDLGPDATISGSVALGIGNGWIGSFDGNADALSINVSGDTTTYDFESYVPAPTTYAQCYFGGWQTFDNPPFSSQAECAQYVAVQQLRQYYCSRFPNLSICQAVMPESSGR